MGSTRGQSPRAKQREENVQEEGGLDLGTPVTNVYWTLYSDHTSGSKWSYVAHISYEWPLDTCLRHILISNSHICEQNTVYREHSFHCTI